jgi:DNA-binding transcriptional regulator YiaG
MATVKIPRKTATRPMVSTSSKASESVQEAVSAGLNRPVASAKPGKTGPRTGTDRVDRAPGLPATARLVADVRSGLGVTREFFARLTGFSVRAITGWEAGRPISEAGLRRIKETERLRAALADGLREEFIPQWLQTPCEGLGGLKPVEALERGEVDRLWRVVLLIGSGMPT